MGFINDLVSYTKMATSPWSNKTYALAGKFDLVNFYSPAITSFFIKHWYNNYIIEKLIEHGIIPTPIAIRSVRWYPKRSNVKIVWTWVYLNVVWTVYYDVWHNAQLDMRNAFIKNPYPDTIMLTVLNWDFENIIIKNKEILTNKLNWWIGLSQL